MQITKSRTSPLNNRVTFWPRFGQISLRLWGEHCVSLYWRSRPRWIDRVFPGWTHAEEVTRRERIATYFRSLLKGA